MANDTAGGSLEWEDGGEPGKGVSLTACGGSGFHHGVARTESVWRLTVDLQGSDRLFCEGRYDVLEAAEEHADDLESMFPS